MKPTRNDLIKSMAKLWCGSCISNPAEPKREGDCEGCPVELSIEAQK